MRIVAVSLILCFVIALTSCGGTFFAFSAPSLNTTTVTGTVTIVRITTTNNGTLVTFVTLVNTPNPQDLFFCGNVVNQFPMNSMVRVNFTQASPCNTNLVVHVIG